MSEKEEKIFETFGKVIPTLSESEKSYLLGLGEGMVAVKAGLGKRVDEEEKMPAFSQAG